MLNPAAERRDIDRNQRIGFLRSRRAAKYFSH